LSRRLSRNLKRKPLSKRKYHRKLNPLEAAVEEPKAEPEAQETSNEPEVEEKTEIQEESQEESSVSQEETEELDNETEHKAEAEGTKQKTEVTDLDTSENAAQEKEEIAPEAKESAVGEVSKTTQQTTPSQTNHLKEQSPVNFGLCAKDIMLKELVWGSPKDSVQQALVKMEQQKNGYLLIGQNGVLEGLVSKSDLAGAISSYLRPEFAKWRRPADDATLQIKVKWIMSRPVHTIKPQTPLVNVMENMCRLQILCLPVVDQQGKVHGLITEADIFNVLLKPKSNPDISASGDEDQGQPTSDYTGIESTSTIEPALAAI